jgi:mannose PTS system EIIA component
MTVNLLLLTHEDVGKSLLKAAKHTLGTLPLACKTVSVHHNSNFKLIADLINGAIEDAEDGLLILTDLYGATPCNIAKNMCSNYSKVVTGLNLPMLIKVMNYANLPLSEMAEKAVEGGIKSIIKCEPSLS